MPARGLPGGVDRSDALPRVVAEDERISVFVYRPPQPTFEPPAGVVTERSLGVHHCNLFSQQAVRGVNRPERSAAPSFHRGTSARRVGFFSRPSL